MRFCILLLSSGSVTSAQSTSLLCLLFLGEVEEGAPGLLALELEGLYLELLCGDMVSSVLVGCSEGVSDVLELSFCGLWLISSTMWRGIAEIFLVGCLWWSRRLTLPLLRSEARISGLVAVLLGVAC